MKVRENNRPERLQIQASITTVYDPSMKLQLQKSHDKKYTLASYLGDKLTYLNVRSKIINLNVCYENNTYKFGLVRLTCFHFISM